MKTSIKHTDLTAAGWSHYSSDWYFYSPTWGSDTHIHLGGNNRSGVLELDFVSLKVKDSFAGKVYDKNWGTNWSLLEDDRKIPYDVAIEFRKALSVCL